MKLETVALPVRYRQCGIENNNFVPRLTSYIMDDCSGSPIEKKRPLVLICPGGGYRFVSSREAEPVALRMNSLGFQACVLDYSCAPMDFPAAFLDLCEAMRYVRLHTAEWGMNSDQIIVCGFSAGGHLAASLGLWWNSGFAAKYVPFTADEIRPNALLLGYSVITSGKWCHEDSIRNLLGPKHLTDEWRKFVSLENGVNADVPPVFIWHTAADASVPIQNTLLFTEALAAHHIPFESHIFAVGSHGLSLATEETANKPEHIQRECSVWPDLFAAWARTTLGKD